MTIADIMEDHRSRERTLTVVNRDEPAPLRRMLGRMVDAPDVQIRDVEPPEEGPADLVILEGEEGPHLAISSIEEIANSVLMVNSDLYITGARELEEVSTPEVLTGLAGATFTVENKQKMLLIEISRHVESLAYRHGDGRLHSGFQQLARIDDERGTRDVYATLSAAGVEAHVYGTGPPSDASVYDDLAVHREDCRELARSWFVVSTECPDDRKAALLAREVGPNQWTGFWTFDGGLVDRVDGYLRDRYWR